MSRRAGLLAVAVGFAAVAGLGACSTQSAEQKATEQATALLKAKLPLYQKRLEAAAAAGDFEAVRWVLRSDTILRWDQDGSVVDLDAAIWVNARAETAMQSETSVSVVACMNIVIAAGSVPRYRDIDCPDGLAHPEWKYPISAVVKLF